MHGGYGKHPGESWTCFLDFWLVFDRKLFSVDVGPRPNIQVKSFSKVLKNKLFDFFFFLEKSKAIDLANMPVVSTRGLVQGWTPSS